MNNPLKHAVVFTLTILALVGCKDQVLIPKPPTYLKLDLPEHSYQIYSSPCGYSFEASSLFEVKDVYDTTGIITCHKDIKIPKLNAVMHFSFIPMKEPLSTYVNFSNDKVDEHKLKATAIEDEQIIRSKDNVFGTFFELQGDVASPFQFYLTDSTDNFVSGVIYFNNRPNYDSLRPTLDYLKIDLMQMMKTFKWK
jgi:gliding motility-associated lipoprotein GldD